MSNVGSAAVGTADAPVKGMKGHRQSASVGPRRRRSRSPPTTDTEHRVPAAEKMARAPVFVTPGSAQDVEGMRSNTERVFEYLPHIEQVVNDHADALDAAEIAGDSLRARVEQQALEIAHVKAVLAKNDEAIKTDMVSAIKGVWDFLEKNNTGIRHMFQEAEDAVVRLGVQAEEAKAAITAMENKPSAVASGPKGLAFVSLRADLKKLEEKLDNTVTKLKAKVDESSGAVNAAFMAAGAAVPGSGDGQTMRELEKLEEAMEDRFALLQIQLDSTRAGPPTPCPCVNGKCPCRCSRDAPCAPVRAPPRPRRSSEEDEFTKDDKDPWGVFQQKGPRRW